MMLESRLRNELVSLELVTGNAENASRTFVSVSLLIGGEP